jgi:riboflavin kinase/FMN adenylyltransferase
VKPSCHLYRHLPRRDTDRPSAVTIGNFDGVHLGHQAILDRVRAHADRVGLAATVMTFSPHPRAFFARMRGQPELAPAQISTLRDKVRLLCLHGAQQIVLARFDERLAGMAPEDFICRLLVEGLNTRWLLVGEDFRYGHKRAGDIDLLRRSGRRYGFEVETIADVPDASGRRISSSDLRQALATGDLARAHDLLGHAYRITGRIGHGRKLGRTIGYRTLNQRVPESCALRNGVYIVKVHGLSAQPLPGVASLGVRPTVTEQGRRVLETHLLDCDIDAYGKLGSVEFVRHLRDEEKFPDLPTLIAAIDDDARRARHHFALHGL